MMDTNQKTDPQAHRAVRARIETVLHPVRLRIIEEVSGRELTAGQLAAILSDVPQTTLYRHLKVLVAAGNLKIVEERPIRGTVEKVYAQGATSAIIGLEEARAMTADDWMDVCKSFAGSLIGDFSRYLRREDADPVADLVGMRKSSLDLSREEFLELMQGMSQLVQEAIKKPKTAETRRWIIGMSVVPGNLPADDVTDSTNDERKAT